MTRPLNESIAIILRGLESDPDETKVEFHNPKKDLVRQLASRVDPRLMAALRKGASPSALLMGPTGIGKTSGARWLMAAGLREQPHYFVRSVELCECRKNHPLGAGPPELVDLAKGHRYLILDDVGTERDPAELQEVLDYRYFRSMPTVVTTGLNRDELTNHIGAASVRRILEQHAGHKVIVVDAFSWGES